MSSSQRSSQRQAIDYFNDGVFEAVQEAYETTHGFMMECLEQMEPSVSSNSSAAVKVSPSNFSIAHLPAISLPPFAGHYNEWEQFRDRFTTLIINNTDLTDFARMHFLTSCVKGRALECIRNIKVTGENIAWNALVSRYENKRRLLKFHLSTLLNLTVLSRESAGDLQTLRDQVNIAVASLHSLQRTPLELWEDMLVHLIV